MIQLLYAKKVSANEIHREFVSVCGETVVSRQHTAKWYAKFTTGGYIVTDHARGDRPSTATTVSTTRSEEREELLQVDGWQVSLRQVASECDMSPGVVQQINVCVCVCVCVCGLHDQKRTTQRYACRPM